MVNLFLSAIRRPKSPGVHLGTLCKGFTTSDPQRNVMGESTERCHHLFLCFLGIPKSLKFLIEFLIF